MILNYSFHIGYEVFMDFFIESMYLGRKICMLTSTYCTIANDTNNSSGMGSSIFEAIARVLSSCSKNT